MRWRSTKLKGRGELWQDFTDGHGRWDGGQDVRKALEESILSIV